MPSFFVKEQGSDLILHNKYGVFSKEELESQLIKGALTIKELSLAYNLKSFQLEHIFDSLGITHRNFLNDTRVSNPTITHVQHQLFLGTLLGDASMVNPKFYKVTHGMRQLPYVYHIAECLGSYVSTIHYKKEVDAIELYTNRHDKLIPYFNRFYSHGKKKKYMCEGVIHDLEPIGLAYWYMDDGKYSEYGAYLCVGNISIQEGDNLRYTLENKFNLSTTLQNHDIDKGYYNIYIKSESRGHFFDLIGPYIIDSMRYKIVGETYPERCKVCDITGFHLSLCNKLQMSVRFSGDTFVEKEIQDKRVVKDPKQIYIDSIKKDLKLGKLKSQISLRALPSEDILRQHFEDGLTDLQIAQKYGFGRNTIAQARRSIGIPRKVHRKMENTVAFPCLNTKLVPANKVFANEYNPNKVATPEMKLLIHSIEEDGVTQPVVTFYDPESDRYIVIDGFHRYTVLTTHFKCKEIPVVVLDKPLNDRMASTVRHNRARGRHQVDLMGVLVKKLFEQGWSDERIADHLGMEGEELLRLRQQIGCARLLANKEFSKSWEISE
jgi:hypothetical protein